MSIDRKGNLAYRHLELFFWDFHMSGHPNSMDASVGAAGTVNAFYARENFRESLFDLLLHSQARFLHLPAGVASAVISDSELEFEQIVFHPSSRVSSCQSLRRARKRSSLYAIQITL